MLYSILYVLSFLLLHPTNTAAQSFFPSSLRPEYFAPPIDTGTLAINAVMAFFMLVVLGILISYLFRGKRGHMSSAAVLIVGTVFLLISYILNVVSVLAIFTIWGEDTFTTDSKFLSLTNALTIFKQWSDPVVLMAIACIIRDRYVAWNNSKGVRSRIALVVILLFVVLTLMIVILDSASIGVANTRIQQRFTLAETVAALLDQLRTLAALAYARGAFYILSSIVLLGFCIHLKRISSSDSIVNILVFGVVPLEILYAIASVIFAAIQSKLTIDEFELGSTFVDPEVLLFAVSIVNAFFYLMILGLLSFFYLRTISWDYPKSIQQTQGLSIVTTFPQTNYYSNQFVQPNQHWNHPGPYQIPPPPAPGYNAQPT